MSDPSQAAAPATAVREAIDQRRFPWIRPLVSEYAHDFDKVSSLFAGNPARPADWRDTIARVTRGDRSRSELHDVIARQMTRRGAPPEAHAAAQHLLAASSVAVVTGQQAGVFGGPLYTLLKAVTAIQLARQVKVNHGVDAVPVFWVDSEDHDWDEVRSARVLDAQFAVADVAMNDVAGAGTKPIAGLMLDDSIGEVLDRLAATLAPTEFSSEVMAGLRRRYQPGTGVAAAFAGWIEDLLGHHGLVVFEASDPAVKPLVADVFVRELERPGRTAVLARDAGALMTSLGHQPQVEPGEDSVALFYLDGESRRGIHRRGDDFAVGDDVRTAADLRAEAAAHPERFSPNVLLRPIVQDRLFPTACYIAGPSELAYLAQLKGVYGHFDVEPPLLYSRASATILDSAAARFLDRYALPLEALQAQDDSSLNHLLESLLPPELERAIEDTDRMVNERTEGLKAAVAALDPTLTGAVETTRDRMHETLKSLHAKIIQAAKRKDETLRRQFARTRVLVFPDGDPQERALNVVFFLNRYGLSLGDRLIEALPLETDRHYVLTF